MRLHLLWLVCLLAGASAATAGPLMHYYRFTSTESFSVSPAGVENRLVMDIAFPDEFVRAGGGSIAGTGPDDLGDFFLPPPFIGDHPADTGPLIRFGITASFVDRQLTFLSFDTTYGDDVERSVADAFFDPAFATAEYDGFIRYEDGLCGPARPLCGGSPFDPLAARLEFLGIGQAAAEVPEPPMLPMLLAAGLAVWVYHNRRTAHRPAA